MLLILRRKWLFFFQSGQSGQLGFHARFVQLRANFIQLKQVWWQMSQIARTHMNFMSSDKHQKEMNAAMGTWVECHGHFPIFFVRASSHFVYYVGTVCKIRYDSSFIRNCLQCYTYIFIGRQPDTLHFIYSAQNNIRWLMSIYAL